MPKQKKENQTIHVPFSLSDLHAFGELIKEIRFKNRYFLSENSTKFVENLAKYAGRFKLHLFSEGEKFFRARIHDFGMDEDHYTYDKMGVPPPHKATPGRLNPTGITYLYLANNTDTAVSEVRPWINSKMTIAEFKLTQDISVVNFSNKVFVKTPKDKKYDGAEFSWKELITFLFSMPFDHRDDTAYVTTQYITERMKKEGAHGILYDSALSPKGYNLALFNDKLATCSKLYRVRVNSIGQEFECSDVK